MPAREKKTSVELSPDYGLHAIRIGAWKLQLLECASDVLTPIAERKRETEADTMCMLAKTGVLTMERDLLGRVPKR